MPPIPAASRLGARTAFIGKVGDDSFGEYLRGVLETDGVDCAGLRRDRRPTTMAIVSVDARGERSFRFVRGADSELSPDAVNELAVLGSKILHFGSVSLTPGLSRSATIFAARSALVDILKLAEEELPLLTGTSDLDSGSALLEDQGIRLILITLGSSGVFCRWQGRTWQQPGIPVKVADTNGAGDTLFGAVLSRLSRREGGPLADLTASELKDILAFANRAAAFTCSRSGAIPAMPRMSDLFDEDGRPRLP